MKDIRLLDKTLPVILLKGTLQFPLVQGAFRILGQNGESLFHKLENQTFALALNADGSPAKIGTLVRIDHIQMRSGGLELQLEGLARVEIIAMEGEDAASYEFLEDKDDLDGATRSVLIDSIKKASHEILDLIQGGEAMKPRLDTFDDADRLIFFCLQQMPLDTREKQSFLEMTSPKARGLRILELLAKQRESLRVQQEMAQKISQESGKNHRDNILREQMRVLQEELNQGKGRRGSKDYRGLIEATLLPEEVKAVALEEVDKLESAGNSNPETGVIRNYLDLILALPWKEPVFPDVDLKEARKVLDEDHFGLEKVKDLIIQHLAVMKLKKDRRGYNLLLVGPPGVGKTSLGRSIAKAMGRNFIRASLGGVRDDAEVRGHRRTYVGALPGRIIQSMKRSGTRNPVFLLDEIDKLSRGWSGDPSSALLEVLDPEQNHTFQDHYLEVPFDLSQVFFIATANSLESIPQPLLDRMEVINLTGYTDNEKAHIARNHLIPKQLEEHGMTASQLNFSDEVLGRLISQFTREAGVRDLQRKIAALCRIYSEKVVSAAPGELPVQVESDGLEDRLGRKEITHEEAARNNPPGVATGLAWTPVGGDILFIESTAMAGTGHLTLTGQLGDVMKESAQIALSLIRTQLPLVTSHFNFKETDIHVHVPSGSIPKDGPSAGIALLTALASLVLGRKVDPKWAFSGEVTLRGAVTPVGGIKEKVIAAHRAGIRTILLCSKNQRDLKEIPPEVLAELTFHFVDRVSQVLELAFGLKALEASLEDSPQDHREEGSKAL